MNPITLVLGSIYALSLLFFLLIAIAIWLRSRKLTNAFTRYGMVAGLGLIVTEILAFFTIPGNVQSALPFLLFIDCIAFFRLLVFTAAGMYCCARLGIAPFRIFAHRLWLFQTVDTSIAPTPNSPSIPHNTTLSDNAALNENDVRLHSSKSSDFIEPVTDASLLVVPEQPEVDDLSEEPLPSTVSYSKEILVEQPLSSAPRWQYWLATFAVASLACLYSTILFLITKPTMSSQVQQLFGTLEAGESSIVYALIVGVAFAYAEEIAFRLGIQNMVAYRLDKSKQSYWLAILITTLLWTIGHTGTLDPDWVKLLQIFPIGIMLGWLFRRHGIESAFIAHALFNVIMVLFGESLIVT